MIDVIFQKSSYLKKDNAFTKQTEMEGPEEDGSKPSEMRCITQLSGTQTTAYPTSQMSFLHIIKFKNLMDILFAP